MKKMSYKDLVKGNASKFRGDEAMMWESIGIVSDMLEEFVERHPDLEEEYWEFMREQHEAMCGHHFNEMYARWQVEHMHHKREDGSTERGEHWPIEATTSVLNKHRGKVPSEYNEWDFYVALNTSWHDFICWAKRNFSQPEEEVIELAIVFWFADDDWPTKTKVWDYFAK